MNLTVRQMFIVAIAATSSIFTGAYAQIKTSVDSAYIYPYEKTKYVPPVDKTLLIVGQSLSKINEYRAFTNDNNNPAGWSAYWAVTEFSGFKGPWTTSSGDTQDHHFLVKKFDNMVLHSAMWMVGKWEIAKKTSEGQYDNVIQKYARWAKKTDRPVYLRLGYEFDGPHNELEPREYIKAFRHIVDVIRKEGVENVAFVWHSYASTPYKNYALSEWYPGDDYVDWVAISVFFQPYDDIFNHKETNDVINFAKEKKKPVMIAEANPVNGIDKDDPKVWNGWFVDFFSFCYNKNIKAIAFINENWPRMNISGIGGWKDARLYNNAEVAEKWLIETRKDRYLKQSPELYQELGYRRKK
ncbi:MAG: glycosyl hydrolase [Ekhidna sp.]